MGRGKGQKKWKVKKGEGKVKGIGKESTGERKRK